MDVPTVDVTPSAIEKLRELRGNDPAHALLRMYVMGRTCCGYRHGLHFAEHPDPGESVIDVSGLPIALDPNEPTYRQGASIDYVETADCAGFLVQTPGSSGGCTCHAR
jgi:iron-sulfur cluster assembly accessory protein